MAKIRTFAMTALFVCLLGVVLLFGWGVLRKMQLDSGSQETAIALLETSFSSGDTGPIVAAAHPQWLLAMPEPAIRSYLQLAMDVLGPLQSMTSITGTSTAGMLPLPGEVVEANYVVEMEMGTTAFETTINLRHQDGEWLITNLMLNADALME